MKKIPTLFERIYINHHVVETTPNVTPGMECHSAKLSVATLDSRGQRKELSGER